MTTYLERGRAFVQSPSRVARRREWEWRRCPCCGSTVTSGAATGAIPGIWVAARRWLCLATGAPSAGAPIARRARSCGAGAPLCSRKLAAFGLLDAQGGRMAALLDWQAGALPDVAGAERDRGRVRALSAFGEHGGALAAGGLCRETMPVRTGCCMPQATRRQSQPWCSWASTPRRKHEPLRCPGHLAGSRRSSCGWERLEPDPSPLALPCPYSYTPPTSPLIPPT